MDGPLEGYQAAEWRSLQDQVLWGRWKLRQGQEEGSTFQNQLKPFNGTCDRDESWIVGDPVPTGVSLPSTTNVANGPGVIILEDDVFPMNADVEAPSEEPGPRRSQRERRAPAWVQDYHLDF